MNTAKAVQKFSNYLEQSRKETYDGFLAGALLALDEQKPQKYIKALKQLDKEYIIASSFLNLLKNLEQPSENIFLDFKILSDLLEKSGLNAKECTSIILMLVQRNIKVNVLEEDTIYVNINDVKNHQFKTMSKKEVYELILKNEMRPLSEQAKTNPELTEKIEEIFSFSEKHATNITKFRQSNAIILSSYFEKQNTFDEQDIQNILLSLKDMEVSTKILKYIEITLNKNYQKRNKEQNKSKISFEKLEPKKKYLNDKEYKKIRKELGKYYNLYHNELLKELTNEEMIYCLSLLYQLGVEETDIDNFILRYQSTRSAQRQKNAITDFLSQWEKINYHQDNEKVQVIKNNLLEYMSDIFVVDDEEYSWVKEEIEEEMNKFYHLLKGNYDYEKSIAKKRIKK